MVRLRSPAPYLGDFPSGQRGQTVNLLSLTSVVRIHHPPPSKKHCIRSAFLLGKEMVVRPPMQEPRQTSRLHSVGGSCRRAERGCGHESTIPHQKIRCFGIGFFYPSRRLGISSPHNVRCISSRGGNAAPCISSRASVYPPAA